jgi:hypothetical protein
MQAAYFALSFLLMGTAVAQTQAPENSKPSNPPAEMTYKGELVDAGCASSGASPTSSAAAESSSQAPKTKNRAPAGGSACAPSASTAEFALRLEDGRTLKFDSVGNVRAQEALKAKKKWSDQASAGKPVHAKVHGMVTGDALTVLSID